MWFDCPVFPCALFQSADDCVLAVREDHVSLREEFDEEQVGFLLCFECYLDDSFAAELFDRGDFLSFDVFAQCLAESGLFLGHGGFFFGEPCGVRFDAEQEFAGVCLVDLEVESFGLVDLVDSSLD